MIQLRYDEKVSSRLSLMLIMNTSRWINDDIKSCQKNYNLKKKFPTTWTPKAKKPWQAHSYLLDLQLIIIISLLNIYLLYKTKFSNFKFKFLKSQQLKNKYANHTLCCVFVIITQQLGWEFDYQQYNIYIYIYRIELLWIILCWTLVIGTIFSNLKHIFFQNLIHWN